MSAIPLLTFVPAAGTAGNTFFSGTGSVGLLIIFALIAIGFSFFCSVAEAVLLSVTPSYIATLTDKAERTAKSLKKLKENIDAPLAAILSLNTIAHTVGAAGVGAQAANIWGSQAVAWASAFMTLLILIISEIIPKTLGARYWRSLAPPMAVLIRGLVWILYPLVLLSVATTKFLSRKGEQAQIVTREEVAAMATLSAEGGELESNESHIVQNLFRLSSLRARDIMTPRTVIIAFPEELTVGELMKNQPELPVSRIPIYKESIDEVSGFVLKSEILLAQARDQFDTKLRDLQRPLERVKADLSLRKLLGVLLEQREHLVLVMDDFGGTAGLVTLEDLIETLLGIEIVDEADEAIDMQRLARDQWQQRAQALGLRIPKPEELTNPQTASASEPAAENDRKTREDQEQTAEPQGDPPESAP